MGGILAVVFIAICIVAWIDGGQEPLHPIEEPVAVPGAAQ